MNAGPTLSGSGKSTASAPSLAPASPTRSHTSGSHCSIQAIPTLASMLSGGEKPGTKTSIIRTQPSTVRAIGPAWSKVGASGNTPSSETTPNVGLKPTTAQHAAGIRIDPPESVPSAASAKPAASAAADPPLDPPAVRPGAAGLGTVPKCGFCDVTP